MKLNIDTNCSLDTYIKRIFNCLGIELDSETIDNITDTMALFIYDNVTNKEKYLSLIKILNYCKEKRDILDKQADAFFSTDVDIGRAYELSRIIEIIESEVKTND